MLMLDTNIVSALMRDPLGVARQELERRQEKGEPVCTSVVVQCELLFGLARSGSERLARLHGIVMRHIEAKPLELDVPGRYATLRAYLEGAGTPIGPNDTLIAAHALALNATLVTDNEDEFRRIPGLRVENWLR